MPRLVNIRRKMHEFTSTSPLHPFRTWGWFFDIKSRQYLFAGDEQYMCKVWSRSIGKIMILPQTPSPISPKGWLFYMKISQYLFLGMKNTCSKFRPDPSEYFINACFILHII